MSDEKKDKPVLYGGCNFSHLFIGNRDPNAPPPKIITKKPRKAGAQHDSGWPDWPKPVKPAEFD